MKIYSILSNVIFVLCIVFISACTTEPVIEPPVVVLTPTPIAPAETFAPTSTVPVVETPVVIVETPVVPIDATTAPPIDPTVGPEECVRPVPPEGTFYIPYGVVAGDTLFGIGQKTRPTMTVEDLAAVNCLTNVNNIDVGQQLIVWHSPTSGPPPGPIVQSLVMVDTPFGKVANYDGPLAFGDHAFTFSGQAGKNLDLVLSSWSGSSTLMKYTLEAPDGSFINGLTTFANRFHLDPTIVGLQFVLPSDGDYRLRIEGRTGVQLEFSLFMGYAPYPLLGVPTPIQFSAGETSATISGTSSMGTADRYIFAATAGQLVELNVAKEPYAEVWLEDSAENVIFQVNNIEQAPFSLPATGDYILTVLHNTSAMFVYGDYEFEISITNPVVTDPTATPTAAVQPTTVPGVPDSEVLVFEESMSGWMVATSTNILNDQGEKTFIFNAAGGQNLSIIDRSGSDLYFELNKSDGSVQVGSVSTAERHFLDPQSRGRDFTAPESAEYSLHVSGSPGAAHEIIVWVRGFSHPILGIPERIQFEAGAVSADISGVTAPGTMNRYVFGAAAGQTVTINFQQIVNGVPTHVWLETSSEVILLKSELEGLKQIVLPATDDYILTVIHPSGEVYGDGPYSFTLTIE